MKPNLSIERTLSGLRPPSASHVQRYADLVSPSIRKVPNNSSKLRPLDGITIKALHLLAAVPTLVVCASSFAQSAQSEFVTQVLEPTSGKIERPKDWFYAEGHRGPVYMWTISREDTTGNRAYTTGVRIQAFVGVKEGAGKTAKEFVLEFANAKKKEGKTIRSCPEVDQGGFTRTCLEMEEGPYRILYSLFWGSSGMDMAVISIAGTTKELWQTYSSTFDRMSTFELIDMKRFPQ